MQQQTYFVGQINNGKKDSVYTLQGNKIDTKRKAAKKIKNKNEIKFSKRNKLAEDSTQYAKCIEKK